MSMLGMDTKKEEEEKVAVEVAGSGEMSASLMGMLGIAAPGTGREAACASGGGGWEEGARSSSTWRRS